MGLDGVGTVRQSSGRAGWQQTNKSVRCGGSATYFLLACSLASAPDAPRIHAPELVCFSVAWNVACMVRAAAQVASTRVARMEATRHFLMPALGTPLLKSKADNSQGLFQVSCAAPLVRGC